MTKFDLSLVLACYNENQIFENSIKEIFKNLDDTPYHYEIIFVEDASQDNTKELIKTLLKKDKTHHLRAIYHQKNQGRGNSVRDGFLKAQGKVIGYIDIDLETPAHYIPIFLKKVQEGFDVVCADRIYHFNLNSAIRWFSSKGYNRFRNAILNLPLGDTEAGYKFFLRKTTLPIIKKTKENHWFWDTEIMALAYLNKLKIAYISTAFIKKKDKTSTVRVLPDTIEYLKKLFSFRQLIDSKK
jgi:hypothetical protein